MGIYSATRDLGRCEWTIIGIAVFLGIIVAWATVGIMVEVPDVPFRCSHSQNGTELSNITNNVFDNNCSVPLYNTSNMVGAVNEINCEKFEYDKSTFQFSATERFNLVCDRNWLRQMAKSVYMMGIFIGCCSGFLSDRYGRKTVMFVASICSALLDILQTIIPDFNLYIVLRFLQGISHRFAWSSVIILATELVRKDQRVLVHVADKFSFDFTGVLVGGVSFVVTDYRLHHVITVLGYVIVVFLTWYYVCESPRWLAATNQKEKAIQVTRTIANINGKTMVDLAYLHKVSMEASLKRASFFDLFRTSNIRKRTLLLIPSWIAVIFIGYALLLNMNLFSSDVRIGLISYGALSLPSALPLGFIINKLGRSVSLFSFWIIIAVVCYGMIPLVEDKSSPILLALAVSGCVIISMLFSTLYLYTQELFPTQIRQMAVEMCGVTGRLAGVLAPQISLLNDYWPQASVVLLGTMGLVAAILVPCLPDTTNAELAQTLVEGDVFLAQHKYSLKLPSSKDVVSKSSATSQNGILNGNDSVEENNHLDISA